MCHPPASASQDGGADQGKAPLNAETEAGGKGLQRFQSEHHPGRRDTLAHALVGSPSVLGAGCPVDWKQCEHCNIAAPRWGRPGSQGVSGRGTPDSWLLVPGPHCFWKGTLLKKAGLGIQAAVQHSGLLPSPAAAWHLCTLGIRVLPCLSPALVIPVAVAGPRRAAQPGRLDAPLRPAFGWSLQCAGQALSCWPHVIPREAFPGAAPEHPQMPPAAHPEGRGRAQGHVAGSLCPGCGRDTRRR